MILRLGFCLKDGENWIGDEACFHCHWAKCPVWRNLLPEVKMLRRVLVAEKRRKVQQFGK